MLTARPRGQFPIWRRSKKRLSVCSVLRCPPCMVQAWCVFSKPCTKLTPHCNHRSGHLKTEHTESLFLLRRHLGNWPRSPAVSTSERTAGSAWETWTVVSCHLVLVMDMLSGLLQTRPRIFGFHKMQRIWLGEEILPYQKLYGLVS